MKKQEEGKHLSGTLRRQQMLDYLKKSSEPVSGSRLADVFQVSRQVVVQDIALLRAHKQEILSTNRGYLLTRETLSRHVVKVCHQDGEIEQELNAVVDFGGCVVDVFIHHKVYGTLRAELMIRSRNQVREFLADLKSGKSSPLKNITSGYHYHTIEADSEEILKRIEQELDQLGFLVS